ncbi:MAG: serine/threonine-protein kinase [Betaproteobacteria bacterium]
MAEMNSLGKYEIRRELGRGAMGVVYEGFDPMIKRIVALKTIRADQLAGENAETVVARFRREAQAAGRLNHPNIVSIYDFGEDQGIWFIAMEYIKGRELKDYFQANERFATADIVRIMTQMLAALGYSHRLGVIHRDIKPANVFVLDDGAIKVADFGIAHIESSNMTQAGSVIGTPSYMSPEQILGLPIDGRSDLFSAGVILYQFLTGERPFIGSSTATMHKVLEEDPLPPSRFNVQVPGAMDAVVKKALAKRPDDRYQTAEEFAQAIGAAAQRESSSAAEATMIAPADSTVINAPVAKAAIRGAASQPTQGAGAPRPSSASERDSLPKKSQSTAIAIIAVIALVAIGAGAWTMMNRPTADDAKLVQAPAAKPAGQAGAAPGAAPVAPPSKAEPGTMVISAIGFANPNDPRYANDKALLAAELRADSKSQLVGKALGLMLDTGSIATNYDVLRDRLMLKSGNYVTTVVQESAPRLGKDGLMSMTTQAVVNVRALQKSLNQMSRDERIEFIRAGGDPKVAVQIIVGDADAPDVPAQPSQLAENLLKERIKTFGFRTWSEGASDAGQGADFIVQGEARIRKLSMRLAASGVVVSKYALTSWTVKCIDRATGEEIYFNTALPQGMGSYASDGEALKAIGAKIADEFSRDFFLQHFAMTGRRVTLTVEGMPATADDALGRELMGLPAVIMATPRSQSGSRVYDLGLAGAGSEGDLVASRVLKPLNTKLGQACFTLGAIAGDKVTVIFDKGCGDAPIFARLETNPPAGLYGAPASRQKELIKDPEKLRQLNI